MNEGERQDFIQKVRNQLNRFNGRAKLIVDDSCKVAKRFPDEFFDYIYIDAQHDCPDVVKDIEAWWPKLKTGSLMGGHDINCKGVNEALSKVFGWGWATNGDDWFIRKGGRLNG